jgi:uncharacterized protein
VSPDVKPFKIAVLACALLAPLAGTTTAHASAENPVLTKNALYKAGPLPATTCDELPVEPQNTGQAQTYINEVLRCLENTWGPYLKKAGLPYEPVKVRYVTRMPKKYCGSESSRVNSQAWYCDWDRTITFQLGTAWLAEPSDFWLFNTTTSLYGYHVQKLAGIYDAGEDLRAASKAEHNEQQRRLVLQMKCLSGAFTRSVWPIKGRTTQDWNDLLASTWGGDPAWGKAATIRHWMRTGFRTGDPGSCNTWTAPSSKVA